MAEAKNAAQKDDSFKIYLVVAIIGFVLIGAVLLFYAPQIVTLVRATGTS